MAHRGGKKIKTVAFVSLGCPKNLVDSERMLGLLAEDGLAITADHSAADAIIVNTCGFLEASKEESLAEIQSRIMGTFWANITTYRRNLLRPRDCHLWALRKRRRRRGCRYLRMIGR